MKAQLLLSRVRGYKSHREKTKSWTETRRIMEREVLPVWRHLRVVDVKRRTVRELVERKARHAPIMANRILSRISVMLTFAMEQDWIESNPAWRIRQPGEERSRDRVLSRDELREPGRRCTKRRPRLRTAHRSRGSRRR
jgi:site-specific recombinase XerD